MNFSFVGPHESDAFQWFARGVRGAMETEGHAFEEDPGDARLVLNFFPSNAPKHFRRRATATFVCSVTEFDGPFNDPIKQAYPTLIQSLANLVIGLVPGTSNDPDAHFLTPEQGHYRVPGDGKREEYFQQIVHRLSPLATSTLVIDNHFEPDLPENLWNGDRITASIGRAGRELDGLNLLPAPFPLEDLLPSRLRRHLGRLFGIGGLSYGNISARYDADWFWMSASGVDKSRLEKIGKHILMVKGYDEELNAMRVAHPPDVTPSRVSVDAIEHWMIYQEHPSVGAILHFHGWIDGCRSTEFNYPCGTRELGQAVADIVREADDPARCMVGLKNHGMTITGENLDEIFDRIRDRVVPYVPMG